jgi:Fic family protein
MAVEPRLPDAASSDFILWLHREFYKGASDEMLRIRSADATFLIEPGKWRSQPEHDVAVGRYQSPSSETVVQFMNYFAERYRFDRLGKAARILVIPAAHHRFNFIHSFPDGNGRVSRLISHAILVEFVLWFLRVCLDQVTFMAGLFDLATLTKRIKTYVERSYTLKPEASRLLEEAHIRGEFERGDVPRITGLLERTARRVFNDVLAEGLLASETLKGPMSLRFTVAAQDMLFPRLFAGSWAAGECAL